MSAGLARFAGGVGKDVILHSVFFAKQLEKKNFLCSSTIRPFIQMIERDQNHSLGGLFPLN
jgi:hypothetical protein